MATSGSFSTGVPAYLRRPVALLDSLDTDTSRLQSATISECLPLLNAVEDPSRSPFDFNEFGLPSLEKEEHVQFLQENLAEFPAPFVGIDASRPWMVYWALLGLYLLGEDVSPFRSRYSYPTQLSTYAMCACDSQELTPLPGLSQHSIQCKMQLEALGVGSDSIPIWLEHMLGC